MYKFFKPKNATNGQSSHGSPQTPSNSPDLRPGAAAVPIGSSPGTPLRHPNELPQNDFRREEALMDQISALNKTIQERELEYARRIETLIEALSEKAEENIQILNELEAVKSKMRAMVAEEEERAAAAAAAAAHAESSGNTGAQLVSPQLPISGDPEPIHGSGEISLSDSDEHLKSGEASSSSKDGNEVTLEQLKKALKEEREKSRRLENSIRDYKKKMSALEAILKDGSSDE